MWLRRHSHLMDAVSGGVRSWMGWGVGCACAVWVTWGIDRVRLHTVSIPRRRQTLWTSGSCLILHLYTCPSAECKEKACKCFSWELVSCSWKCVTEVFRLLAYSRLLDLWAWRHQRSSRGRMTIITNIYMHSYNRATAGFCIVNLQSPSLKPSLCDTMCNLLFERIKYIIQTHVNMLTSWTKQAK